jgi:hypothetical protein
MPVRPEEVSLTETYYRLTHIGAPDSLVATGTDHRFDHDDEENSTSYLGDSVTTALNEVEKGVSADPRFSVRIRPGDYRLVTAQLRLRRVWDLRNPATKEALGPVAELISTQSHPEELKNLGREARRAGIQGFLWESAKTTEGVCLVVFLENVRGEDIEVVDDRVLHERPG